MRTIPPPEAWDPDPTDWDYPDLLDNSFYAGYDQSEISCLHPDIQLNGRPLVDCLGLVDDGHREPTSDELFLIEWDEPTHEGLYHFQRNREFRNDHINKVWRKGNDSRRREAFQGPGKKCRRRPDEAHVRLMRQVMEHETKRHCWASPHWH